MSKDQKQEAGNWLRGDLPTWIGVGLIGIICWGGKQAWDYLRTTLAELQKVQMHHETRITVLESERHR